MAKKVDVPKQVIEAALGLAAERGWRAVSLGDIAEAAQLPLSQVLPVFPTKQAILSTWVRRIDAEVLGDEEMPADWAEGTSTARDRLFDVTMRRFDALAEHRQAIGNLLQDQCRNPLGALCGLCQLRRSMAAMLETAQISAQGPCGALRVKGLCAIYLATLRVWLKDDTADMAKTMATLDGHLRRVEALLRGLPGRSAEPASEPA